MCTHLVIPKGLTKKGKFRGEGGLTIMEFGGYGGGGGNEFWNFKRQGGGGGGGGGGKAFWNFQRQGGLKY